MAGKFLKRDAIIDTIKSEERMNALRRRAGLTRHPVHGASCGCSDPGCGAFHWIDRETTIPAPKEVVERLGRASGLRSQPYTGSSSPPAAGTPGGGGAPPAPRG